MLRKREQYRHHFHDWDIEQIAQMTDVEIENILLDSGIIRNRLKVYSVRKNAIVALQIQKEFGSLDVYFWNFVDQKPIINHHQVMSDFVAESDISKKLSKDLKKRGMSFV